MNNLSIKRRMWLLIVSRMYSSNNHRTFLSPYCHLQSQENDMSPSLYQRSLELCIFCKSSCCPSSWFCFCHYVSARSLAVWGVFPPIHVSFREEMINMWLQVGSREAGDGWERHFVDCLSLMPVWRICWAFLCMVSWQIERFTQRHIRFGAGTSNWRLKHVAILRIYRR